MGIYAAHYIVNVNNNKNDMIGMKGVLNTNIMKWKKNLNIYQQNDKKAIMNLHFIVVVVGKYRIATF